MAKSLMIVDDSAENVSAKVNIKEQYIAEFTLLYRETTN